MALSTSTKTTITGNVYDLHRLLLDAKRGCDKLFRDGVITDNERATKKREYSTLIDNIRTDTGILL